MPDNNQNTKSRKMNIRGLNGLPFKFAGKNRVVLGDGCQVSQGHVRKLGSLGNGDPESIMLWGEDC